MLTAIIKPKKSNMQCIHSKSHPKLRSKTYTSLLPPLSASIKRFVDMERAQDSVILFIRLLKVPIKLPTPPNLRLLFPHNQSEIYLPSSPIEERRVYIKKLTSISASLSTSLSSSVGTLLFPSSHSLLHPLAFSSHSFSLLL